MTAARAAIEQLRRGVGETLGLGEHESGRPRGAQHLGDQQRGARIVLDQQDPRRAGIPVRVGVIGEDQFCFLCDVTILVTSSIDRDPFCVDGNLQFPHKVSQFLS